MCKNLRSQENPFHLLFVSFIVLSLFVFYGAPLRGGESGLTTSTGNAPVYKTKHVFGVNETGAYGTIVRS